MALGGRSCRAKGVTFERECVNEAKAYHLRCERVPLSGAGTEKGDIKLMTGHDRLLRGECKRRRSLPAWIAKYFGGKDADHIDFISVREDRGETYIVIRAKLFWELCQ
jgi:Holliday junction resolvase